jgi:hypothetical protein
VWARGHGESKLGEIAERPEVWKKNDIKVHARRLEEGGTRYRREMNRHMSGQSGERMAETRGEEADVCLKYEGSISRLGLVGLGWVEETRRDEMRSEEKVSVFGQTGSG